MVQSNSAEFASISPTETVALQSLEIGAQVRLRSGAVGEVTANPRDGGWVFIRYLEHPKEPSLVGRDSEVFCADVVAVVKHAARVEQAGTGQAGAPTLHASMSAALPAGDMQQMLQRLLLEREIERFLYHEAELLDER